MNMDPELEIIKILKKNQIDLALSVPCARIKNLLILISKEFQHIPITREEEGVGIAAGAYLAGKKPTLLIQSGGIGNSVNALMSLSKIYSLPLPIIISWRGVYKEKIEAQKPMGQHLIRILEGCEIPYLKVEDVEDIEKIDQAIQDSYKIETPYAILLSPKIWESSSVETQKIEYPKRTADFALIYNKIIRLPTITRFDAIQTLVPYLKDKLVISNIGIPSKELYYLLDQPSNFYMLGSLGMASSIGLGVALGNPKKEIIVIDGDGSLLYNPNALCMIGNLSPKNLTIIAMDNGTHGSTGDQITAAYNKIDLELLARSFGIKNTAKVHIKDEIIITIETLELGPRFIHVILKPGKKDIKNIPLSPETIKKRFMDYLREHG
ncbi:MAG: sulfopyruvate decarboxylase subunit beta [Candidatus Hodarchaeota archaeon]